MKRLKHLKEEMTEKELSNLTLHLVGKAHSMWVASFHRLGILGYVRAKHKHASFLFYF